MNNIQIFQERIGTKPDGDIGPKTMKAFQKHYVLTAEETAHFFAQISHETGGFKLFEENLNYSASGLRKIFGKYFPTNALANLYARKPKKIGSRVYANRMGNGDESSQEGWFYRGRGALQLTGKNNYKEFQNWINTYEDKKTNVIDNPDLIEKYYSFESAIHYFDDRGLWKFCKTVNDQTILVVTKRINGGTNGLHHRNVLTKRYYDLLK